jgi:hypothetical protein
VREDLRALDDAKLAQLANRGLVKRARRMLEAEKESEVTIGQDGTVLVTVEGAESRLPPNTPLAGCDCSCGARGVCRHLIFAVMLYNDTADSKVLPTTWDPGELSDLDLASLLGSQAMSTARRLAGRGMQIEVRPGTSPVALLPTCTVTFLVPNSLAHAACDCASNELCEHLALAVWAFREAKAGQTQRVELGAGLRRHPSVDEAQTLMTELLADGTTGAREDLPERMRLVAKKLAKFKMVWMGNLIEEVADRVSGYGARAAFYDSLSLSRLHTEWFARERASRRQGKLSSALILGLGEAPETALEHIRLTALGARLKRREEVIHGEIFLADPDTSTVLVYRKSWSAQSTLQRINVQKGLKFVDLAAGQLVSSMIKRRANRTLMLGQSRVARSAVFAQTGDWGELFRAPLLVTDYARLAEEISDEPPSFLKPRVQAEGIRVLQVERVRGMSYFSGSQTLLAQVEDTHENCITLKTEYSPAAPGAIPALVSQLQSNPRYISGEVKLEPNGMTLLPLATVADDGMIVLALQPDQPFQFESDQAVSQEEPTETLFDQSVEVLSRLVHRGLRFDGGAADLLGTEESLMKVGMVDLAGRFCDLRNAQARFVSSGIGMQEVSEAWADAAVRLQMTREVWLKERFVLRSR